MPKRNLRLFLADILEAINKIERYTVGFTFQAFEADDMVVDAVVRNLEIIGEAARQIPLELRDQYHGVDWVAVVGFRNIVIHAYFDVDLGIVWTIATERLPELAPMIRQMIEDLT